MIIKLFELVKIEIERRSHLIHSYNITEKIYSEERGYIQGQIDLLDDSRLDFIEVIDAGKSAKIKYRYHYMSDQNSMIFRYDNARHHPEIATFPHHKHLSDHIAKCEEPNIATVLSEIERIILSNGK